MLSKDPPQGYSLGLRLRHRLEGFTHLLNSFAWSPDGRWIAAPSENGTVAVWDNDLGCLQSILEGATDGLTSLAWSPNGKELACGGHNGRVYFYQEPYSAHLSAEPYGASVAVYTAIEHAGPVNTLAWSPFGDKLATGSGGGIVKVCSPWAEDEYQQTLPLAHLNSVTGLAWSPDGRVLAVGSLTTSKVYLWDVYAGGVRKIEVGHVADVRSLAWSRDGRALAVGLSDHTIRVFSRAKGKQRHVLEGHTDTVISLSFSPEDLFLASKSDDDTVRLWRCGTWETVEVFREPARVFTNLAFHPHQPVLATLAPDQISIRVWEYSPEAREAAAPVTPTGRYVNAKVVLVGDTGVGKSGLGLVLSGQPFAPTESTHGRNIWTFDTQEIQLPDGRDELRETLLWDMAGQPGYRLIHQLHLNEVSVALIVFDGRSDTDPFAGVRHWNRALRQAHALQGDGAMPMRKFLVAARTDRGGIGVSRARVEALMQELGLDRYFETSAKEGWQVAELAAAIREALDWSLPKVSSPELFHGMREFLLEEKQAGRILSTSDDLYRAFLRRDGVPPETPSLRTEFETCIISLESRDLIQRLSFGGLILLQPEMIDNYASALVNSAKEEPDGLGSIAEDDAREARFRMPQAERIANREQEKLLLIATIEDLIRHEIALREQTDHGAQLVFPSQLTRDRPEHPEPQKKVVTFTFEGPLMSVYATLAVRLSHSGVFENKEMWRNATTFTAKVGGTCGMLLRELEEARGELVLFFDAAASEEISFQFEEYVYLHLQRRAIPESIRRRRTFVCAACETPVSDLQAQRRRARGYQWLDCSVCDARVALLDREERLTAYRAASIVEMDQAADATRARETAALSLEGKIETNDFDVFLAHSRSDEAAVRAIARQLRQRGLYPWVDKEQVRPGRWFQDVIQQIIPKVKSVAVFVGPKGLSRWQTVELRSSLSQLVERDLPVIPILLPGVEDIPNYLIFLKELNRVRFSSLDDAEALDKLVWGITGKSPQKVFK